ncbi:glycosyltransferase family 2 protein [Chelatococcus reniformis]|uniref:glycosyltransferase family 2 protein n=1 Tax=Chelatococcus reniformis TaxID=1494448 RepID=UPI00166EFE3E|nr:glycosyltransferase family 2 protein [Chelatococcus reniformis]
MRNEAELLPACLDALFAQRDAHGRPLPPGSFGILLLLNNCGDASASVAARYARAASRPVRIVDVRLPPAMAHAGAARRAAMDLAGAWLTAAGQGSGAILTTDADSRVPATWIDANLAILAGGVDAVAGLVALAAPDEAGLGEQLRRRGGLEQSYQALLMEAAARLDPLPHDPWPNHWTASGATIAVRRAAYAAIGGIPMLPAGEDRALVTALVAHGFAVRHEPSIVVTTSGRLAGRASGGVADTLRLRRERPDSPCDPRLEPVASALGRYRTRNRLRRLHDAKRAVSLVAALRELGMAPAGAAAAARLPHFEAAWTMAEVASPALAYRPLAPAELPVAIAHAEIALAGLRRLRPAIGWGGA